uniref:RNA-directed DNA polymerase n=1 Tax=Trichogramma kaykai TaxID=54128 RepID=A0ABD2VTF6_9HYME
MFRLMGRLRLANLTVRPDKCHFLKTTVTYLGHIISEKGVEPDPSKISAVSNFPRPKNRKNIKQFLGLAGYYRRFVKDFAKIAKPLTSLLKADTPWDWTDVQEGAFGEIKQILSSAPLLQYPDFNRPFVVVTDGSDFVISGILSQEKIGNDLPIAYTSRILTDAEINYSMIEKELLGIVNAVQQFRPTYTGGNFKSLPITNPCYGCTI